jgi:hypothetical protein
MNNNNSTLNNRMLATAVDRIRQNCNPGIVTASGQQVPINKRYSDLLKSLDDIVKTLDYDTVQNPNSLQRRHHNQS